jgi:hypothetical protein
MRHLDASIGFGIALAVAVTCVAGRATADQVHLTFGNGLGDNVTVNTPSQGSANTMAAPYSFTISGTSTQSPPDVSPYRNDSALPNGTYYGFCIQFNQDIGSGSDGQFTVESLVADLGQKPADQILALLADYLHDYGDPGSLGTTATLGKDALTIAIWDVLTATGNATNNGGPYLMIAGKDSATHYDNLTATFTSNKSGGVDPNDTMTGAVGVANKWLKGLQYNVDPTSDVYGDSLYPLNDVVAFYNSSLQDQSVVIGFSYPFTPPVPEPSTLIGLAGMGLMGLLIGGVLFRRGSLGTLELLG